MLKHTNSSLFDLEQFFRSGGLIQVSVDEYKVFINSSIVHDEKSVSVTRSDVSLKASNYWKFLHTKAQQQPENHKSSGLSHGFSFNFSLSLNREDLLKMLALKAEPLTQKCPEPLVDQEGFEQQFQWSRQQFENKILEKTVPIIKAEYKIKTPKGLHFWCLSQMILNQNPGWVYGMWSDDLSYLGKTPESLGNWSASKKTFDCMALAGTIQKNKSIDAKTDNEHQIVVQDILQVMKTVLPEKENQIQKSATKLFELKNMNHLKTELKVENTTRTQALELVEALHPTAALGLSPRHLPSYQKFNEFDLQKNRGYFGGALTFDSPEQIVSLVMIRSLQINPQGFTIFSGCGVTEESILESEHEELILKRNSVLRMAGLLDQ